MKMKNEEILTILPEDLKETVAPILEKKADETGLHFKAIYSNEPLGEVALCNTIQSSRAYIVSLDNVTSSVMDAAGNLKIISKLGVGTDNIDCIAAAQRDIEVANCPGSNSNAVAELSLGLMISMARKIIPLCNDLRSGKWEPAQGSEITGKCIGILGFGNVGKRLAELLKPFNMKVLVYDAFPNPLNEDEYDVSYTSLDEIAKSADYISIHLPLLKSTYHLIDKEFLSKTKKNVFILNMARGGIIDEEALVDSVKDGHVAQVATDVFEKEPPFGSSILSDSRIIVLPHIGAATTEALGNMLSTSIDNIVSVLQGKENPNPVRT